MAKKTTIKMAEHEKAYYTIEEALLNERRELFFDIMDKVNTGEGTWNKDNDTVRLDETPENDALLARYTAVVDAIHGLWQMRDLLF